MDSSKSTAFKKAEEFEIIDSNSNSNSNINKNALLNNSINNDIRCKLISSDRIVPKLISLLNTCFSPFVSIFSALVNKMKTGHYLTTTNTFKQENPKNPRIFLLWLTSMPPEDIKKIVQELWKSGKPFLVLIPIGCQKIVPHSTVLGVGRSSEGVPFAAYFDADGTPPDQANILASEQPSNETKTVKDLYGFLMKNNESSSKLEPDEPTPDLIYSNSHIQVDKVSCTAYSALFIKKISAYFEQKDFSAKALFTKIANHEALPFLEARDLVHYQD